MTHLAKISKPSIIGLRVDSYKFTKQSIAISKA